MECDRSKSSSIGLTAEQVACAWLGTTHLLLHWVRHAWSRLARAWHLLTGRRTLTHGTSWTHISSSSSRVVLSLHLHALELVLTHREARVAVRTARSTGTRLTWHRSPLIVLPIQRHLLSSNIFFELRVADSVGRDSVRKAKDMVSD